MIRPKKHMKSSFIWLINLYTVILTMTVLLVTTFFVWSSIKNYNAELNQAETTITTEMSSNVSRSIQISQQFANQLVANAETLDNLNEYFTKLLSEYSDYATDRTISSGQYFFWPNEARLFLMNHPQVTRFSLRLANQKKTFVASQKKPGGELIVDKSEQRQAPFAITTPLVNPYTLNTDGTLNITFSVRDFEHQLSQIDAAVPMQLFMRTPQGKAIFYYSGKGVANKEQQKVVRAMTNDRVDQLEGYRVQRKLLPSGYTAVMVVNQTKAKQMMFSRTLPIVISGLILLIGLSSGLRLIFRRYQQQLEMIVDTVSHFSADNLSTRVAVIPEHTDLKVLADGINRMFEEIHEYVYTIYQLKISNQEANIRALQAQINPHFMSNTLEYIRMAAIDANQPELAKVVYSFAALLKNNTDFSAKATLKEELSFVDKYIYLYQVRFPDRLAYQIKIDADVSAIEVPKFMIQPIVENYFVHGVDFTRNNNALSIKVHQVAQQITIEVINNGHLLTEEQVVQINQKMRDANNVEKRSSIGLQNVYLRMKAYFGESFDMAISVTEADCVKVTMHFTNVEG
ncbi:sensor histidine kinase [Latilactobacillus curvatus]|uniref:sensor histidine kinase n=1 Tax=Latilactobacillus curvatus TaxID=28038 RepID=UPI000FECA0D0|nr:histidine kinase [Latilactobacillus curvatus]QAR34645.1 two-component sensor histidine kinase [Latilactobacillus curvatus]